ncbi:hypothetical protein ACP70R_029007 [Stipagrostis hirtigluma subsp. patula]
MAAAAVVEVESRKRCASPFLDEPLPAPSHLAKRGRFSPWAVVASQRPQLSFDPLDALRRIFPDADPRELESSFAASGRDIHATVEACRARQAKAAAAARLERAARVGADGGGGMDECAGVLVEQMAAAADVADAKNRASWALAVINDAVAGRASAEAAALREENAALRAQAAALERDNAVLKRGVAALHKLQEEAARDNAALKRGVAAQQARQEETDRAAAELKKKVAELEMANYALGVRLRDADSCRFQAYRG